MRFSSFGAGVVAAAMGVFGLQAPIGSVQAAAGSTLAQSCSFPGRVETNGQQLQTTCGATFGTPSAPAKGFDVQINPGSATDLSETDFADMKAEGASYVRFVVHWNDLEPSQGVIDCNSTNNPLLACTSGSYGSVIQQLVQWANQAHLYSYFSLYWTDNPPAWLVKITGCPSSCIADYTSDTSAYGQLPTVFLAQRYGNTASPFYLESVMGFGLNETDDPTPNSNQNPDIASEYTTMLSWVRSSSYGDAPEWLGLVQMGAGGDDTGIYNDCNAGWGCGANNQTQDKWVNTVLSAYQNTGNSVGTDGDVVVTIHDYELGTIPRDKVAPTGDSSCVNYPCDGRTFNGTPFDVSSATGSTCTSGTGGYNVKEIEANCPSGDWLTYPITWTSSTGSQQNEAESVAQASFKAFVAPALDLGSGASPAPVSVEEWSWNNTVTTGGCSYIADQMSAWNQSSSYGASMESWWDYSTGTSDVFASSPAGVGTWKKEINYWMKGSCTGS